MGKIRASITHRLRSITEAVAILITYFDEEDIELERSRLANDLYDIDAQVWGLVRDIEQYRAYRPKQGKEG